MAEDKCQIVDLFKQNIELFSALGDSHRQRILLLMADGMPKCVSEVAAQTELSRPTVSHHIKILKNARLLDEKHVGRRTYYFPVYHSHIGPLKALINALEKIT